MLCQNICDSRKIDSLSSNAEVLYYRLYTHSDDFGRCKADPLSVRSLCFQNGQGAKARMTLRTIAKWIDDIEKAGLWTIYEVDGQQYLQFTDFDEFQNLKRERKERWPGMEMATKPMSSKNHPEGGELFSKTTHGGVSCSGEPPRVGSYCESSSEINNLVPQEKLSKVKVSKDATTSTTFTSKTNHESGFFVMEYDNPVVGLNKDNSEGMEYNAETVRAAIHWAYHVDPKQYWVRKIQTLTGLRKCITTMVAQMGDYRVPIAPIHIYPAKECPVCDGDGYDEAQPFRQCSCVEYRDDAGKKYDYWEYRTRLSKRAGTVEPLNDWTHEKFSDFMERARRSVQ